MGFKIDKVLPLLYQEFHQEKMEEFASNKHKDSLYFGTQRLGFLRVKGGLLLRVHYEVSYQPINSTFVASFWQVE